MPGQGTTQPAGAAATPWQAPADWRAVDVISDLHLWPQAPRTFNAWAAWMAQTDADALFILGDLFEVWIGDDTRSEPFAQRCIEVLQSFSRTRPLYFICGNRDFLVGDALLADCGMRALPDPIRLDVLGQSLLLSHGDALCLADVDYQRFRQQVRQADWQRSFLARPVEERAGIARAIRSESQGRKEARPDPGLWADVDADAARRWLRAAGAQTLVHGHTHRPGQHDLGEGLQRIVLSDWDCDADEPRAEVLRLTRAGFSRQAVQPAR